MSRLGPGALPKISMALLHATVVSLAVYVVASEGDRNDLIVPSLALWLVAMVLVKGGTPQVRSVGFFAVGGIAAAMMATTFAPTMVFVGCSMALSCLAIVFAWRSRSAKPNDEVA